jgi:hypothetical protein
MYMDSPFVLTHLEPTGLAVDRLNQSRSALDQASQRGALTGDRRTCAGTVRFFV